MNFKSYICYDGVPPLWPKAPTWPSDSKMKEKLARRLSSVAKIPMNLIEMYSAGIVRGLNDCWGHLVYLAEKYDSNGNNN